MEEVDSFFSFLRGGDERVEEEIEPASSCVEEECDETCAICQDDDGTQTKIRLECGHVFHAHCACHWFRQSPACPLCRDTPSMGAVCVEERATLVRRFSRSRSAPRALKALVCQLRKREDSAAEKRRAYRAFKKRNAHVLRELRRLERVVYSARDAVERVVVRVGVYHCAGMPVPPLRGDDDH